MTNISPVLFWIYTAFLTGLGIAGLYSIFVSHNLIRILIGIELIMKSITLLIILIGKAIGKTALAQALVINLIVIEVFFITVACGVVLSIYNHTQSMDIRKLFEKKSAGESNG